MITISWAWYLGGWLRRSGRTGPSELKDREHNARLLLTSVVSLGRGGIRSWLSTTCSCTGIYNTFLVCVSLVWSRTLIEWCPVLHRHVSQARSDRIVRKIKARQEKSKG